MPKEEPRFICDVCGMALKTMHLAEECEKKHLQPDRILRTFYSKSNPEFPSEILVALSNQRGRFENVTFYRKETEGC